MSDYSESKEKRGFPHKGKNFVLAFGFAFVILGVFLFAFISHERDVPLPIVRSLITTLAGGFVLYFALIRPTGSWTMCCGLFLVGTGIFILMVDAGLFSQGMKALWPVVIIIAGVSAFIAGCYKSKKIRLAFLVPAVVIIVLGVVFLLFSTDIISEPFFHFAGRWWPSIFILVGLVLVAVFFLWNKKSPLTGMVEDEDDDFSDIDKGESGKV